MCLANNFSEKSDALDPQVLHMMTFKTCMKTSYLVETDAEQVVNKYILLYVLVWSIAEYFCELFAFWLAIRARQNANNSASKVSYNTEQCFEASVFVKTYLTWPIHNFEIIVVWNICCWLSFVDSHLICTIMLYW